MTSVFCISGQMVQREMINPMEFGFDKLSAYLFAAGNFNIFAEEFFQSVIKGFWAIDK